MTSPQIIQQADDLKASVADTSSGSNEAWVSRQALQDLYQKLLVMDLEFALDKKVEQDLWNHAFKNQITVLQNQAKDKQNPKRSEIQSSLNLFLETAGGFYLQLLQELCSAFKLDLPFRRKSSNFGVLKEYDSVSSKIRVPKPSSSMYICQHCLVHLGDIARYRQQIDQAQSYYRHAAHLVPYNGQPYNQLAILEAAKSNKLATVFYYARSIAVKHPFPVASTNLDKFYTKISKETYDYRGKLSMSETISTFLQFHAFIHLGTDSDKARKHGERLMVSLPTHLTSTSFSSYQLVQMVAINLFSLHHARRMSAHDTEHADNKDAGTDKEGSRAFGIVFDLTMSMMEQLVYNTPKQEQKAKDYHTMPALKVIMDWLLSDNSHLAHTTCVNSGIWGNLSKLLNNLQFHGGQKDVVFDPDKYTRTPLPEDCDLQCFLPLMKAGADLNFTKATTDIIAGEMEIRLRCHRLVEHGQYIADNFSTLSLLTYTRLKSGRLQFSCPLGQVKILTGPPDIERKHVRQNVAIQAIMQKKDVVAPTSKDASTEQSMRPMDAARVRRTSIEDHRGDSNVQSAHSEVVRKTSTHVAQPLPQPVPQPQQPQPPQPQPPQHAYQQQQQFQQYGQYVPAPYPQYQPHQPLSYQQQQQHQQQQQQQHQHQQQHQQMQQQHQQQHSMGMGMNGGDTQQHPSQPQVSARDTHSPGSHGQMGVHLQPQMGGGGHLGGYSHGPISSQGSPQGLSPAMRALPHQQSMPQGMHGYNITNSGSPRGSLDLTGQQQGGQKSFQPAPGSGMSSVSQSGLAPGAQFSSQVAPPQPVGHHQGMLPPGSHGAPGVAPPGGGRSGMFPQSQSFPQNFPQSYPQQSYNNANQQFVDGSSSRVPNMFPSSSPTNNNLHSSPSFGSSFPQARAPSPQTPQSLSTTPNTILNLLNSGSLSSGFGISPAMMALASAGAPSMASNRNPQMERYMRHREDGDLGYTPGQGLGQVIGQGIGQGIGNFSVDTESNPAMMLHHEDFNKDEPELKFSDLSLDSDSQFSPSSGLGLSGLTINDQTRNPKTGSPINIPSGISSLFSLPTDAGIGAQTNSTYSLFSKSPWTVQLSNKPDSNKSLSSSPFGSGEDSGSIRNTPDPFGDMADTLSSSFPLTYAPFGSPDSNWTNEPNPNHAAAEKANTLLSNSIQSLWSSGPSPLEKLLEQQKQQQRHCDPH